MNTATVTHHPVPFAAVAAVVAAFAIGTVVVSQDTDSPGAPSDQTNTSVNHPQARHPFHPTTSGGRVQLGF